MASRVVMPKLTDTMEEGLIIRWYKQEGDPVESGDALAEIETDKSVMDLEAYASGIIRKLLVPAETKVPAGALIAIIAKPDEDISELLETPSTLVPETSPPSHPKTPSTAEAPAPNRESSFTKGAATPRARKMAVDAGLPLSTIPGTGPKGLVTERDVKRSLQESEAIGPDFETTELSPMRSVIAKRMTQSKQTIPHFYVTMDINMNRVHDTKNRLLEEKVKVSLTDILLQACAFSLRQFPQINAAYLNGKIQNHKKIHIGLAVGLDEGILTPVIRDVDQKSLRQISEESRNLIKRAKSRKLSPEDYTGSTFSLSNLGMLEVDHFIAIIQPGEGAVLAVGSVRDEPVLDGGELKTRKQMKVTLSCDHRVIDGLQAAQFLQHLKHRIEQGNFE